jgi:hypothetical protein
MKVCGRTNDRRHLGSRDTDAVKSNVHFGGGLYIVGDVVIDAEVELPKSGTARKYESYEGVRKDRHQTEMILADGSVTAVKRTPTRGENSISSEMRRVTLPSSGNGSSNSSRNSSRSSGKSRNRKE